MGIIKAAKKTLKRQESGSMKIKDLAKSLVEKFESHDKMAVRQLIEENDTFHVDGKVVMLKKNSSLGGGSSSNSKKRKSSEDEKKSESSNDGSSDKDKKAAKKEAKKAKKEKKSSASSPSSVPVAAASSSSSSSLDSSSIQHWRKEHKIVLRDSRNGEEGMAATKLITDNTLFYPYQTFDTPECVEKIVGDLIRQCTVANGFTTPSPIQAQCWVSSLSWIL